MTMADLSSDIPSGLAGAFIANKDRLMRFFTSRTRDRAEAEEIVQEIYLRIAHSAGPVGDPVSYLHRVGLNLVVDRARERQRRARREQDWAEMNTSRLGEDYVDERPSAFTELAARQRAEQIGAAIAALPPGAAQVFRLHRIDGLSHLQIASQLGISRKGVEKHMATALRHLGREIGE